jgi:hypothetical protein
MEERLGNTALGKCCNSHPLMFLSGWVGLWQRTFNSSLSSQKHLSYINVNFLPQFLYTFLHLPSKESYCHHTKTTHTPIIILLCFQKLSLWFHIISIYFAQLLSTWHTIHNYTHYPEVRMTKLQT